MVSAGDILERHFPGLTLEEIDAVLGAAPAPNATAISGPALDYLRTHGGEIAREALAGYQPGRSVEAASRIAATTLYDLLASALTVPQAADVLGLSRSRIAHRIAERSLYSFMVQNRRYLPRWQIDDDGGLLNGLAGVVPAIPARLHPLAVERFMLLPLDDLDGVSPRFFLATGGDPAEIAAWLTSIGRA